MSISRRQLTASLIAAVHIAERHVIAAFQMHFRPSLFDGTPDAESAAILRALNRS